MIFILMLIKLMTGSPIGNPAELGDVHWLRSIDEAQVKSKAEHKPILIIFQEIPGCITCRTYGNDVLSHPLIVDAIETNFIPLAIYNNKQGPDAEVLQRFNEPAWNNPVVRIVDENGKDLASRLNGNYSPHGLSDMMTNVMIKTRGTAPQYLQLLTDELDAEKRGTSVATYTMYCFWTGEALFGAVNGVISTSAGFQESKEAVKVEYDPNVISKSQLDKVAMQSTCKATSGGSIRPDVTPKYYLSNSKYRSIPMTEVQKCRVNSALAEGQNPDVYLSPAQLAFLKVTSSKNYVGQSLRDAWTSAKKA